MYRGRRTVHISNGKKAVARCAIYCSSRSQPDPRRLHGSLVVGMCSLLEEKAADMGKQKACCALRSLLFWPEATLPPKGRRKPRGGDEQCTGGGEQYIYVTARRLLRVALSTVRAGDNPTNEGYTEASWWGCAVYRERKQQI